MAESTSEPNEFIEPPVIYFSKADYITTKLGNKISRNSVLCGSDKIVVLGKTMIEAQSVLRGDLSNINIGKSCIIAERVVIRPPEFFKGQVAYLPVTIGNYVVIERDSVVEAVSIGHCTHIGKNCVIGKRCMLSECCRIMDDTVLAPGTIVPPLCVFAGNPGVFVAKLPESYQETRIEHVNTYYKHFRRST
eukprot:TRINITY_DN12972_c0_g1_i1.p1 TRINITY_DN12972_c0_g1~~TRINITY_DN12972_c0_g1_i1.p1  ORF type:complete len:216 (-),score=30.05 TRINITY_DN12972_c0_g1_i1:220-792(-)